MTVSEDTVAAARRMLVTANSVVYTSDESASLVPDSADNQEGFDSTIEEEPIKDEFVDDTKEEEKKEEEKKGGNMVVLIVVVVLILVVVGVVVYCMFCKKKDGDEDQVAHQNSNQQGVKYEAADSDNQDAGSKV